MPSSCALLGGFAVGARVSLLNQYSFIEKLTNRNLNREMLKLVILKQYKDKTRENTVSNWQHMTTLWQHSAEREMSASACTRSMPGWICRRMGYIGRKLRTGGVSDHDTLGSAIGWWSAACGIKSGRSLLSTVALF